MPDGQDRSGAEGSVGCGSEGREALLRDQVERALIDVSLLRSFISSRNETSLGHAFTDADFPSKPPEETPTRDAFLRRLSEIEQMEVATLAHDPKACAFLFAARDTLNAVAAPADAYTIAFSGFYTGSLGEETRLIARADFAGMKRQARTSRIVTGAIAAVGVITVILAVVISVHALVGKAVLTQVAATRLALEEIDREIEEYDRQVIARMERKPDALLPVLVPLCERMAALALIDITPPTYLHAYESVEHVRLCRRRSEAARSHVTAQSELAGWIETTTGIRLATVTEQTPLGPVRSQTYVDRTTWISWLPGLTTRNAEAHVGVMSPEVAKALLTALAVYYLPVIFGVLGGTVYAVRRLNQKIIASELHPRDWRHALLRIFMAFLLGGCIGLFFQPEGTKLDGPNGTISLSIAALSFLAGYSVEVVFRFFDLVITQALRIVGAIAPAAAAPR